MELRHAKVDEHVTLPDFNRDAEYQTAARPCLYTSDHIVP